MNWRKIREMSTICTQIKEIRKRGIMMLSIINEIKEIISYCEEVQKSQESTYTKECAKIVAYDQIKEIVEEREE